MTSVSLTQINTFYINLYILQMYIINQYSLSKTLKKNIWNECHSCESNKYINVKICHPAYMHFLNILYMN